MSDMRWACTRDGCYLKRKVLKFDVLKECLPGKMSFMDIDAAAEVNGRFLFMEWKGSGGWLGTGQELFYKRLTKLPHVEALAVYGDAETMRVQAVRQISNGKWGEWEPCNLAGLKVRLKKWSDEAMEKPSATHPAGIAERLAFLGKQRDFILNLERTERTLPETLRAARELQEAKPSWWNRTRIRALEFLMKTS